MSNKFDRKAEDLQAKMLRDLPTGLHGLLSVEIFVENIHWMKVFVEKHPDLIWKCVEVLKFVVLRKIISCLLVVLLCRTWHICNRRQTLHAWKYHWRNCIENQRMNAKP